MLRFFNHLALVARINHHGGDFLVALVAFASVAFLNKLLEL